LSKSQNPRPTLLTFFHEQVDCFGGSVGDTTGGEVGQQFIAPEVDGGGQPDELGNPGVGAVGQPPVQGLLGAGANEPAYCPFLDCQDLVRPNIQ